MQWKLKRSRNKNLNWLYSFRYRCGGGTRKLFNCSLERCYGIVACLNHLKLVGKSYHSVQPYVYKHVGVAICATPHRDYENIDSGNGMSHCSVWVVRLNENEKNINKKNLHSLSETSGLTQYENIRASCLSPTQCTPINTRKKNKCWYLSMTFNASNVQTNTSKWLHKYN